MVMAMTVALMREGGAAVAVFDCGGGESREGRSSRVGSSPLFISI